MGTLRQPLPVDSDGRTVVPDGLWAIWYYDSGMLGLASLLAFFLYPAWLVVRKAPPRDWLQPGVAPAVIATMIVVLFCIDCLFNAMLNPLYIAMVGALVGWAGSYRRQNVPAFDWAAAFAAGPAPEPSVVR